MNDNELIDARNTIDEVDSQLADLFEKRMAAVLKVVSYKQKNNLPVFDLKREKAVIEKNTTLLKNQELKDYYADFLIGLMEVSKKYQRAFLKKNGTRIGFQGTDGSFSQLALNKYFGLDSQAANYKSTAYEQFKEVFDAVSSGELDFGVLPFENSYTGEVSEVLDLLKNSECLIYDMVDVRVSHCLLGVSGADISDIKTVYSHPQALSQCKEFLDSHSIVGVPCLNTAFAAKQVAEQNDKTIGAVASAQTALLYSLNSLAADINTSAFNTTRFIIISKTMNEKGNRFCLLFSTPHKAGQLAIMIDEIGKMGFNMDTIHSMPQKNNPWEYYFFVEIEGDGTCENASLLLKRLKEISCDCRMAGIYTVNLRDKEARYDT